MTNFWQRWLTLWCVGVIVFGLVLFGVGFPQTSGPASLIFALFGNPLPDQPDRYLRFAISLMGAVTAGWGVTYYAAFRAAWMIDQSASVWRILTLGTIGWFIIDCWASVANGFAINAVSNTALIILYLIPIMASNALQQKGSTA